MTIFRSGLTITLLTFISRIFGLTRELFIANLFGASSIADAVNIAFKLPNLFRRTLGEGALSTVFIPMFNEKILESSQAAKKFAGEIFILLLGILILLVSLIQLFMPKLMFIIVPGFYEDKEKFDLTVLLCRITLPYLIFISITALFGGILNSVRKFTAFAFSPVILSIVVIIGTLILNKYCSSPIAMSLSVMIAGIMQFIFMLYCTKRARLMFPLVFRSNDKSVKKFFKNMGPAMFSASTEQVGLFISQSIASFIPGAVSILSYADRIYQFPLSIIGITFSTILLPELSRIYKLNDITLAHNIQNKAIKIALLLSFPAACGIMFLSTPIIHIIYERGAFTNFDTIKTSQAIFAYAFGLPAFVLAKILTPIFYANGDTNTPFKITLYTLAVNIVLNIILIFPLQHIGIVVGTSIAAWFNVLLLYKYTKKVGRLLIYPSLVNFAIKVIISCAVMCAIIFLIQYYGSSYFYSESSIIKIFSLGGTVAIGGGAILLMSLYFRLHKVLLSK